MAFDYSNKAVVIPFELDGTIATGNGAWYAVAPMDMLIDEIQWQLRSVGTLNSTTTHTEIMIAKSGGGYADLFAASTSRIQGTSTANKYDRVTRSELNTTGQAVVTAGTILRLDVDDIPGTASADLSGFILGVGT